jgi:hypothetical protein
MSTLDMVVPLGDADKLAQKLLALGNSPTCYQAKVDAHVAKTIAAKPELVQISTAYGVQQEGSPVLPRNKYTAIRDDRPESKDDAKRPSSKSASSPPKPSSPREAISAPSTRYASTQIARCIIPSKPATEMM